MDRKTITKTYRENHKDELKQKSKVYRKENKNTLKEKADEYRKKNKGQLKKSAKEYREKNIEREKQYRLEYREKNKERIKEAGKVYRMKNKGRFNDYRKNRKQKDKLYFLSLKISNMIYKAITCKYNKNKHTVEILGCAYSEFKDYLESQFEPWMNWDNYGLWNGELNYGWDIDHIIPLTSATTEDELIKLNHYTNLKPLCSHTNRYIKKDKLV